MEKQIETTVELAQDQIDLRALLSTEIVLIGGGDYMVGLV